MNLNLIISIHPIYVNRILNGEKKFEYRKSIFKKDIDKVYIYSTFPEKKIVGYFNYTGYIQDTPQKVWESTKEFSGLAEELFFRYFDKKANAYAIKIDKIYKFTPPIDPFKKLQSFTPPQSFKYLQGDIVY